MTTYTFDLVDPVEVTGMVRQLPFSDLALKAILPDENLNDIRGTFDRGSLLDKNAAKYRTFDTEARIGKRQGVEEVTFKLPPVSEKIPLGEEDQLNLRAALTGNKAEKIQRIFDDAAGGARAVAVRLELARAEAINTGKQTINENGVAQTIDFGRVAGHDVVLTGTALWSAPTTATPLANLRAWHSTYKLKNGTPAGAILMGETAINNLLINAEVRAAVANESNVSPVMINRVQLSQVLTSFGLPPIVQNDEIYMVDDVAVRAIPANRVIMVPPRGMPLGKTFYGITAEALHLNDIGRLALTDAAGVTVVTMFDGDPVTLWTKTAAIAIPILTNPNLTFAATVG